MAAKSFLEKMKNLLTNLALQSIIAMFRRSGRVSCKLNNERTKAPDGSTCKCATKLSGAGLSQLPAKLSIKSF